MNQAVLDYLANLGDVSSQIDDCACLEARMIVLECFENNIGQNEVNNKKALEIIHSSKEKIISRMKDY